MASGLLQSCTVLTDKFEREPEEYTAGQLKQWLKCRGLKLRRKQDNSVNHHTLDPSIDDGKWFSAKVFKENAKLQANCSKFASICSIHWVVCFPIAKHTFTFQLWARPLLRIGIGGRY